MGPVNNIGWVFPFVALQKYRQIKLYDLSYMYMGYRAGIKRAIESFSKRELTPKRQKRNEKPEAVFLLKLKKHLESRGFSIDVIEAKGEYDPRSGHYKTGKVRAGYSDMSGNDNEGRAIFIEVKAPGKRKNLSHGQHEFLSQKINTGCFAIVCDSIEYFEEVYKNWRSYGKEYLLKELPPMPKRFRDDDLNFDD